MPLEKGVPVPQAEDDYLRGHGRDARVPYAGPMHPSTQESCGDLLRTFRKRRRLSQLELALGAELSQRHLSFLESGRALPSREMILRLTRFLGVGPRERNQLLTAAGYAPVHRERSLDDPALAPARRAVELVLEAYRPFPALAVDRHWQLLMANAPARLLLAGAAAHLLVPPINVLRLSLAPDGLASRIVNLPAWREHVLSRLRRQVEAAPDAKLRALLVELEGYPHGRADDPQLGEQRDLAGVAVPLQLRSELGVLSFLATTTVFGTPLDLTLSELVIEAFLPADEATVSALRAVGTK